MAGLSKVTGAGITDAINNAIDANTAKVTNYNQTKSDIEALGIKGVTSSATAPSSPTAGDLWFDTSSNVMKTYSGTTWDQMSNKFSATGGTVTTVGGYRIHTFTSSGTFTAGDSGAVDVLVVAGGGGGGSTYHGGGGGAGGFRESSAYTVSPTAYTITVGAGRPGGVAGLPGDTGIAGNNSVFSNITSLGGGGGSSYGDSAATSGGSGGGGAQNYITGASGTSGQGNNGGNAPSGVSWAGGGGGGGKGAVGGNGTGNGTPENCVGGVGGVGAASTISGSSVYYAGGGGGSGGYPGNAGAGGNGGGGAGGHQQAADATANTGGGGGGSERGYYYGSSTGYRGGNGGSGIVIIRYAI